MNVYIFSIDQFRKMNHHKSQVTFAQNPSLNIKQITSPLNKKIEGFDRTNFSTGFISKVQKLKNKPKVEGLEDQYIKGLQDEIKFLQMELKLLQQKDMEKHGQIDQLQKFFGDGIPINQNILAIKNGFNNYKNSNEKKVQELTQQKNERVGLIGDLSQKVQKLALDLHDQEKNCRKLQSQNINYFFEQVKTQASLKKTSQCEEDQLKDLKHVNRKISEKIEKLSRNKLIENIMVLKSENHKNTKLNQLRESIKEKEVEFKELEQQYLDLTKLEQGKNYIIKLEEQNLTQKKKNIVFERQLDNLRNMIKQRSMDLQQKLKERGCQIDARMDLKAKVDSLKQEINKANSLTVEDVSRYGRQKQIFLIKKIIEQNKKLAKYTDHYSSLLSNIQNQIQTLAQRKPEVKAQISAFNQDITKMKKKIIQQKERQIKIQSQLIQIEQKFNFKKELVTPLMEKTKKNNQQITSYLGERKRLIQDIKIKQKQLELIFILKKLNFEEVQMSKVSNKNLQDQLIDFLKNWEKISKNA